MHEIVEGRLTVRAVRGVFQTWIVLLLVPGVCAPAHIAVRDAGLAIAGTGMLVIWTAPAPLTPRQRQQCWFEWVVADALRGMYLRVVVVTMSAVPVRDAVTNTFD